MAFGKIRALHPEFFSDDDLAEVSIPARLLFAGLWCFACDNGHLRDRPKQIKRWVYATDDVSAADLLRELEGVGVISRGGSWITVNGLAKKQRIDWRYFKTCEFEGCEKPSRGDSERKTPRAPAGARRAPAGTTRGPATDGDGDGDIDGDGDRTTSRKRSVTETPERFDEFWDAYDHKVGRRKAEAAYRTALKKPGVTPDLLVAAAAEYVAWVKSDGKHPQFTKHPTTWLNGEHWRDERVARQQPMTRVQQHLALAERLADEQGATIHQIGDGR